MRNWKTTLTGIAGLLSIVVKAVNGGGLEQTDITSAIALVGLLVAKDFNTTGTGAPK